MSEAKYDSSAVQMSNQIVDEMQDDILAPFNAGVYFSKYDLLGIAESFGSAKRMNDRKKLLKEIFRYVDTNEDLKRLLGLFVAKIDNDFAMFDEIEKNYKSSELVTAEWREKGNALKAKFSDMIEAAS